MIRLEEVIGIRPSNGSLAEYGVSLSPGGSVRRPELLILKISEKLQSMRKQNW
jgi:hypothetical protein